MRVFVTGAAGFIGQAVVQDLLKNGHQVIGLARSDQSAEIVRKAGGEPHRGDLNDIESLRSGARDSDGVIHLAFVHELKSPEDFANACAVDRVAITAMGEAMAGTNKPLVVASGTMVVPKGVLATEDTEAERGTPFAVRGQSADLVYSLSKDKQVRGMVIRLTPTVHDAGDHGTVVKLISTARENGYVTIVKGVSSRWPAVHRLDAATLFRLALEKGVAGATYNAVAEQGVQTRDIASVISRRLQLPVEEKSIEEAANVMGLYAHLFASDNPTSSQKTQNELDWVPIYPGLLVDMETQYFD